MCPSFHFSPPNQWSQSVGLSQTWLCSWAGFREPQETSSHPRTHSILTPGAFLASLWFSSLLLTAMHRYQSSPPLAEPCSGSKPEQTLTSRKKNVSPKQVGTRALSSFHQSLPQAESTKNSQWWCRLDHAGAFSISGYRITCQCRLVLPCELLKPCSWKDTGDLET